MKKQERFEKTIYGVGYLGEGDYISSTRINGQTVITKEYICWYNMIKRCYNPSDLYKNYKDITVCEEWHNFQNFAKWYYENYYNVNDEKMDLDKDILYKGNKIYSPETCIFVPHYLNALILGCKSRRGSSYIGVSFDKERDKYKAFLSDKGKTVMLGRFNTEEKAFQVYKDAKEKHIKQVLNKYKEYIPQRLYNALYDYKIEITD